MALRSFQHQSVLSATFLVYTSYRFRFLFADIKAFLRFNAFYCLVSILLIIIYTCIMIPFTGNYMANVTGRSGSLFPEGTAGIFYALPYTIWFYVGIECIPFLSEETENPTRNIPRGLILGMTILTIISVFVLLICPGSSPGIDNLVSPFYPLAFGIAANYNVADGSALSYLLGFASLSGNISSFLGCLLGCHRSMYALSRAGLFPSPLSLTTQRRGYGKGSPYAAIIGTGILMILCASISFGLGDELGQFLILMCIAYALISYTFTFCAFIKLRFLLDQLRRPFTSPFGIPGAILGACCSIVSLVSVTIAQQFRLVSVAIAVQVVFAGIYYMVTVRHRVAFIPEKLFLKAQLKEARDADIVDERKAERSGVSGFSAPLSAPRPGIAPDEEEADGRNGGPRERVAEISSMHATKSKAMSNNGVAIW